MVLTMVLIEDVCVCVVDDNRGPFPSLSRYPLQLQPERELTIAKALAVAKHKTLESCSLISHPPWLLTMMTGGL